MTWGQILRLGAELLIDALRGKLEPKVPKAKPPAAWRHLDSEVAVKASRCAGHEEEPQCKKHD